MLASRWLWGWLGLLGLVGPGCHSEPEPKNISLLTYSRPQAIEVLVFQYHPWGPSADGQVSVEAGATLLPALQGATVTCVNAACKPARSDSSRLNRLSISVSPLADGSLPQEVELLVEKAGHKSVRFKVFPRENQREHLIFLQQD